jgi:hypothetical protein
VEAGSMSCVLPLAWAHALTVAAVKEDGRGSGEHVVRAAVGLGTCTHGRGCEGGWAWKRGACRACCRWLGHMHSRSRLELRIDVSSYRQHLF